MHGASYVQLERAVSPVGSAWERGVQIHILLHGAGHLKKTKQKKRKRSLKENMKFVCFFKFPVQITVRYLTGFHLNQGHERKCRALFVKSIIN